MDGTAREFEDGQIVAGTRYRVRGLIGAGGMGSVYEVEHVELGKRFVLKVLLRELTRREDLVARLRNEWRSLARLEHPNIVSVSDAGTTSDGVPFFVMERLEGETLSARLKRQRRFHVPEALRVAAGILSGLSAAHEIGVVHRDVKPPNVFLVAGGAVKLLDFGIAKIQSGSSEVITARGVAIGTPRYMSPEQARGDSVDGRADLYAAGLLLFEMIAGAGPFDDARDANELLLAHLSRPAPRLASVVPGVAREIDEVVAALLEKDPRARPSSTSGVAAALHRLLGRHTPRPALDAPTPVAHYDARTGEIEPRAIAALRGAAIATTTAVDAPGSAATTGVTAVDRAQGVPLTAVDVPGADDATSFDLHAPALHDTSTRPATPRAGRTGPGYTVRLDSAGLGSVECLPDATRPDQPAALGATEPALPSVPASSAAPERTLVIEAGVADDPTRTAVPALAPAEQASSTPPPVVPGTPVPASALRPPARWPLAVVGALAVAAGASLTWGVLSSRDGHSPAASLSAPSAAPVASAGVVAAPAAPTAAPTAAPVPSQPTEVALGRSGGVPPGSAAAAERPKPPTKAPRPAAAPRTAPASDVTARAARLGLPASGL